MAEVQKNQALNETNIQFEQAKSQFEIQRMQTNNQLEKELMLAKRKELNSSLEIKNNELIGKAMTEIHRTEIIDEILIEFPRLPLNERLISTGFPVCGQHECSGTILISNLHSGFSAENNLVFFFLFRDLPKSTNDAFAR